MTKAPICAVGAIILHRGTILLVQRDREPASGTWSLPGGRVELGESLNEALEREVREETGLEIEIDGLAGIAERILPDDSGAIEHHFVICDFYARAKGGTDAQAADDARDSRWFPVGELTTLDLAPGLLEFLRDRGILEGRRPRAATQG
jgi:8-oxo-dGTP diphosphatase